MLVRVLFAFCILTHGAGALAFSPVCSSVLASGSLYDQVKRVVDRHTVSRDLTVAQRVSVERLILRLEQKVNEFDRAYNLILSPYGTDFLPRLREKLESMSSEFRQLNWKVINELRRYLNSENLRYRELNLFTPATTLKQSAANRFIRNKEEVYFGLDFFVNTLEVQVSYEWAGAVTRRDIVQKKGYQIQTPSVSRNLGDEVRILNDESRSNDVYPGTSTPSLQVLEEDGLPFSGFPLTQKFLDYLKERGDDKGHINIGADPLLEADPGVLNNLGLSTRTRYIAINQVSRYDYNNSRYLDLKTEEGQFFFGFFDIGQYRFDENGVLVVPGVRVSMESPRGRLFNRQGSPELVISEDANLATYPTRYEFFVALMSMAHPTEPGENSNQ